ncbi:hypothetical protein FACS189454_04020 [Planctomycetales bacterium]|nr:hypothetical protein FACS189454_04020 [Planctomycetales bacterium]
MIIVFFTRDRKTFQDFLGITPYHTIPDAKMIWLFAEQMKNAQLKQGEIPQEFKSNPHRLAQKDCDASGAKKGTSYFWGCKDYPWIDAF